MKINKLDFQIFAFAEIAGGFFPLWKLDVIPESQESPKSLAKEEK